MKKIWLGVLMVLWLSQPALAEKTIVNEFDGTDWQEWTEAKKYHFLTGFLLGSSYLVRSNEPFIPAGYRTREFDDLRRRLSAGQDRKGKPATFSREEMILWGHYRASMVQAALTDYAVYGIAVSQLAKEMDDLYRDGKNVKIPIADAIYAVKKQVAGISREEWESLLVNLRGN